MHIEQTFIKDLVVITPRVFCDERGYFFESFNKKFFQNVSPEHEFVQDNESYSEYGTLRGLHFQTGAHAQSKLVRAIKGRILDVAVDLRLRSLTFGKYFSTELTEDNKKQLFVPRGFAHGFVVLSDYAIVQYKCDNYYNKEAESGIRFDDIELNIRWLLDKNDLIINERDLNFSSFADFKNRITTNASRV